MKKVDLIIWIMSAQENLDTQGTHEFTGPYKKGELKSMKKEKLTEIKKELEGVLYSVGVRSEVRMHRAMYGKYF